jgi:predicted lipoprotein
MLANMVNGVIVPMHEAFVADTAVLRTSAYQFRDEPTVDSLAVLQGVWVDTAVAWKRLELFEFQAAMVLHNQIEKWPSDTEFIENFIALEKGSIDEALIDGLGSRGKGLSTIEYLLFDPALDDAALLALLTENPQRMDYMVATIENTHTKAEELHDFWTVGNDNYGNVFIASEQYNNVSHDSISILANEMVQLLENVANMKSGHPLGELDGGMPHPELVEAGRSEASIALIISNLESVQRTFNGSSGVSDGLGFDDYLNYLDAEFKSQPLADAINAQLDTTMVAWQAVEVPLKTAVVTNPESVAQAITETRTLLRLLKADMANQMGIVITFSDNDGD